jgi:RimJ/RimL family protein N-acetyltransferase
VIERSVATLAGGPHRPVPGEPPSVELLWFDLPKGLRIALRPVHPEDRHALHEGFARLSEESRYQRFLAPMQRLTSRQLSYLTDIDHINHFAWAAGVIDDHGNEYGLGVGRYVVSSDNDRHAEIAVVVADDHQNRGIGTLLTHALCVAASDHSIKLLFGYAFADNEPMLHIFERLGARVLPEERGVVRCELLLDDAGAIGLDGEAQAELKWVASAAAHPSRRRHT